MANTLKSISGQASTSGATIYTVPTGATATIIGLRASNTDNSDFHTVTLSIGNTQISSTDTKLPIGGAYEFTEGSKIIANAGEAIVAVSDVNATVDILVSILEQS